MWRIDVSPSVGEESYPSPSVALISATIGYDSSLFDRVRIRLRTAHHSPTVGSFGLAWTNEQNLTKPGSDPEYRSNRFSLPFQNGFVYTTEWQVGEFILPSLEDDEKVWAGLLRDIRLSFSLDQSDMNEPPRSVDEVVRWLEVDWIELTGAEEILQGELAPPAVAYFRFEEAGLFAPPIFYPITPGLGSSYGGKDGVLTDLDADGDLDLFASWDYRPRDQASIRGWVMALNDGEGTFETVRTEEIGDAFLNVLAGDVTGDGQNELALSLSSEVEVWSMGAELQMEVLAQISRRNLASMTDWDKAASPIRPNGRKWSSRSPNRTGRSPRTTLRFGRGFYKIFG